MPTADEPRPLLERMLRGDRRALARLLSLAESDPVRYAEVADDVSARAGRALRVGVTGPGGVGKSTLIDALARTLRQQVKPTPSVAVLATDPTSERSGGALLGDRVRMAPERGDPGLFFRSVATRGAAGGLAHAAFDQLDLLDAAGFDWILVEAVGAGQSEIEVAYATDVTLVVLAPGGGDAVQALKAGLMEVGDLFCVNKADLPGADALAATLRTVLELPAARDPRDVAPVIVAAATRGTGIDELPQRLQERAQRLRDNGSQVRRLRERRARHVRHLAQRAIELRLLAGGALDRALAAAGSAATPRRIVRELLTFDEEPPGPGAAALAHATPILRVKSLKASLDHYVNVLGFGIEFHVPGILGAVVRDRCTLFLAEGDQGHPGSWTYIGAADITGLFEDFRRKGAAIRQPPTNYPWAYELQVEDLDGNVLRFGAEPKADQPFGPWRDMRGDLWERSPAGGWTRIG